jgi:hypothetical protein
MVAGMEHCHFASETVPAKGILTRGISDKPLAHLTGHFYQTGFLCVWRIPMLGQIESIDMVTLRKSLTNRAPVSGGTKQPVQKNDLRAPPLSKLLKI